MEDPVYPYPNAHPQHHARQHGRVLSLMIQVIDVGTFLLKLLIPLGRQPVADQMGFEIGLFLKDVRRGGPKFA